MRFSGELVSIGAFSCLLHLFHGVGFFNFPLSFHQTNGVLIGEHRWSSSVWWCIHLLVTVVYAILAKLDYNCMFSGLLLTDAMNNYFKYVIGLVTALVTLADSWCSAETHRSIWRCYRKLAAKNGAYLGLMDRSSVAAVFRRVGGIFMVILVIAGTVQCKTYYTIAPGTQWHCFWRYNIYPSTISHMRHLFHLLHISLMRENLRHLQGKLKRLAVTANESLEVDITLNPRKHEAAVLLFLERLEDCRSIYTKLWLANEGINTLFGFSQASNVASTFVQIAFDLYWVYEMWLIDEMNIDVQIYSLLPAPVILVFLMHSARRYQCAVESLEETLLGMPCLHDERLMELRGHFLSQLQRFRLRLTARNIFDFDYTLIRKLAFVVLTYIIIFMEITR